MVRGPDGYGTGRAGQPPKLPVEQLRGIAAWWRHASWRARAPILVVLGIIVILLVLYLISLLLTEFLWFQELGFTTVFWTKIWARLVVMVVAGVVFFGIFYGNLRLARRLVPALRPVKKAAPVAAVTDEDDEDEDDEDGGKVRGKSAGGTGGGGAEVYELMDTRTRGGRILFLVVSIVLSLIVALSYGGSWERLWLFFRQVDFGFTAPIFNRDAAFFVFSLPVIRMALTFAMLCVLFSFIGALITYISNKAVGMDGRKLWAAPHVKTHLSILLAIAMAGKAVDYMLGVWDLAYSNRGVALGPGYTDVNVQIPILRFLAIIAAIAAVLFLINIYFKGWRLPALALGLLFVTWLFAGQIYPAIIQQYRVSPTEIEKETPYIANNIKATRWAFGLNEVTYVPFGASTDLDANAIAANMATIDNIRVWDPAPALDTYRQIQEIRTYYRFGDVDVDRYTVDGRYRQIMLAAREFDYTRLTGQAQTWVNEHLTYTHGYGVVASPVSEATTQGLPSLFIRDIPPRSETSLAVTRPAIYYGELPGTYVLVKTTAKEFDYPLGAENVFTEYSGTGGVSVGSFGRKLIYAVRFASLKLLVSDYLTADSRILYRRSLEERVKTVAPFLQYDRDPYMVIRDDGSLVWLWDAYTTTDRFPNSQMGQAGINYIRNSVKVAVDAFNGNVIFYQMDPDDALANAWGGIYPGIFTPATEMPADIRAHMRYPEDLFSIQAATLSLYHMTDPQIFYNQEDVWERATETRAGQDTVVEPYYLVMALPGTEKEEFVLLQPFTPRSKQNMISWMAARMDGDAYGEVVVINFPKDKLVFGPAQVEARISNDPVISAQITLWDQAGSEVIRGNLLVVPIEDSVIYVEPLYLQAASGAIPELTRVIVAYGDQVVMEPDLKTALETIFDGTPGGTTTTTASTTTTAPPSTTSTTAPPSTTTSTTGTGTELPTDRKALLELADQLYEEAREAQRLDDWATYGEKIRQLGEVISALQALEATTP